jgi:tetratricopeptide (TPR) repeat protein/transcriptional regulator with XRE-family HTH domain
MQQLVYHSRGTMESFSELLSVFIKRIGVTDAELARRLGVSRQTIFRWREGLTQRPRHRPDVLEMAAKLRLTAHERDQLLLAAGFQPEDPIEEMLPTGPHETQRLPPLSLTRVSLRWLTKSWWGITLIAAISILILVVVSGFWRDVAVWLGIPVQSRSGPPQWPAAAEPDETLILVSEFANYGGVQIGYNVAGRLQEALHSTLLEAGLERVRIERIPETITEEASAQRVGIELQAALVLWGEYDSGRVIAVTTVPDADVQIEGWEQRWLLAASEELSATINTDMPRDVQWIAMYVLGQIHFWDGQHQEAEIVFKRALIDPPEDSQTLAVVYFFLGLLNSEKTEADLDEVIAYYSEALALWPGLISAVNNRGVAYLQRNAPGDLERAEADLRRAISASPRYAPARVNLALTIIEQDPSHLDEVLDLLEEAEDLQPELVGAQNGLCWYYSLAGRPEEALPHCDLAVELDTTGNSNDSRGLTLALLGRYQEAAEEFQTFLDMLQSKNSAAYNRFAPTRALWIENASVLQALLRE